MKQKEKLTRLLRVQKAETYTARREDETLTNVSLSILKKNEKHLLPRHLQ
jgi:hypothetical protein